MTYKYFEFLIRKQQETDGFVDSYRELTKCEIYDLPLVETINCLVNESVGEFYNEEGVDIFYNFIYEPILLPEELQDVMLIDIYNYIERNYAKIR